MLVVVLGHYSRHQKQLVHLYLFHEPIARYVKLRVAHVPGMAGTLSPPPQVSDPDMHHDTCVTHVPWCMLWSLTSGFLWSQWWGKRSRHSRRMRKPQLYVSGEKQIATYPCKHVVMCQNRTEVNTGHWSFYNHIPNLVHGNSAHGNDVITNVIAKWQWYHYKHLQRSVH